MRKRSATRKNSNDLSACRRKISLRVNACSIPLRPQRHFATAINAKPQNSLRDKRMPQVRLCSQDYVMRSANNARTPTELSTTICPSASKLHDTLPYACTPKQHSSNKNALAEPEQALHAVVHICSRTPVCCRDCLRVVAICWANRRLSTEQTDTAGMPLRPGVCSALLQKCVHTDETRHYHLPFSIRAPRCTLPAPSIQHWSAKPSLPEAEKKSRASDLIVPRVSYTAALLRAAAACILNHDFRPAKKIASHKMSLIGQPAAEA